MDKISESLNIVTELNGEITELSEEETALLFEFRMFDAEQKCKIQELVEAAKFKNETNR